MSCFPGGAVVNNLPASAGDARAAGLMSGSERSPEVGNGNPLQCSCLENSMDTGAWWATFTGHKESNMTEHACLLRFKDYLNVGIFSICRVKGLK